MGPETHDVRRAAAPTSVQEALLQHRVRGRGAVDASFAADLAVLDLRIAVLLGRYDRFVARAERAHREWVDDTERRMRDLAGRIGRRDATAGPGARDAERARAVLAVLARHLRRLDGDRRRRSAVTSR